MSPLRYLPYELYWALPVIALQWMAAPKELWRWRRGIAATVLLATLYLAASDAFALGHGIWSVDASRVVGINFGPLPLEEALFYLLTNIMAVQGFVMLSGFFREKER